MKVGLVYDVFEAYLWQPGDPPDADAEYEPESTVVALEAALQRLGHEPVRLGSAHELLARMPSLGVDAAVNIAEGARGRNREAYAPILLEMAEIPFLGSDALTLSLSLDKAWTKDLAIAAGVPTPPYRVYAAAHEIDPADLPPFPLFVKPRYEGTAKGITAENKVSTVQALRARVAWSINTYRQDALVEAFIEGGGEFTVAVVGNDPPEALPALQRAVEATTRIGLHALERRGVPPQAWEYLLEGTLDPALETLLQADALSMYHKLECKDFARVDFRVDADGQPWFLEINPLPTFAPDGTFAVVAELLGRPYPAFLAEVLARGLQRLEEARPQRR